MLRCVCAAFIGGVGVTPAFPTARFKWPWTSTPSGTGAAAERDGTSVGVAQRAPNSTQNPFNGGGKSQRHLKFEIRMQISIHLFSTLWPNSAAS